MDIVAWLILLFAGVALAYALMNGVGNTLDEWARLLMLAATEARRVSEHRREWKLEKAANNRARLMAAMQPQAEIAKDAAHEELQASPEN